MQQQQLVKHQKHTATRDVTVQAVKDSPVVDMDNPSAQNEPYTGADSNDDCSY